MKRVACLAAGAAVLLLWSAPVRAGGAEDDLAVVKKAVAAQPSMGSASGTARPEWLKVRIEDKSGKKGNVSINLPLRLARALGDELPIDGSCAHHARRAKGVDEKREAEHCLKLSAILQALEAGERLVEIDSDDARVKVWVE